MKEKKKTLRPIAPKSKKASPKRASPGKDRPRGESAPSNEAPPAPPKIVDPTRGGRR